MRTLTLLCLAPGSHTPFELSDFLEFGEFLRTVLDFSSSKGNGSNHVNQYLTQLHRVGKMWFRNTNVVVVPDTVAFSSSCFIDTDFYQLLSSR